MKHIETIKTIVICLLIAGIVGFVAGVRYQANVAQARPVAESKN